jgi:hypothetical protein
LYWLGVVATTGGYDLSCREFDVATRRWGPALRVAVAQRLMLSDACFRALTDLFSPLARIETTADDARVRLQLKGGKLPPPPGAARLAAPGDAFLPLLRRARRGRETSDDGLAVIPWTILLAAEQVDGDLVADVETALRRPFAVRRRGNVEQLAIGLPQAASPAKVHFFARSRPDEPLVGYEVFRVPFGGGAPDLVGVTDRDGMIAVPPSARRATTLLLRSDAQVLAKLVVAGGVADVIDAPIADDAVRLAAQAEVQAVREELVDLVARRAIMIARAKALLKKKKVGEARQLVSALNELPTPSTFTSRINSARDRLPTSDDPRVRQTVDGLFDSTRELLARFLDLRTVANLQAEVNEAARAGAPLAPGQ